MDTPAGNTVQPKVDVTDSYGALLIGVIVSAALFGVTCLQVFYYSQNYKKDGWIIKSTVVLLLLDLYRGILEALHSAFSSHAIYYFVIVNYLNPTVLPIPTSARMAQTVSCAIVVIVQLFYVRRVHFLSRQNVTLVTIIVVLALGSLACALVITVDFFRLKLLSEFVGSSILDHIGIVSLTLCVAADLAIAASLSYYLHTSRSGIDKTNSLINKLMLHTINNGVITSILTLVVLGYLVHANGQNIVFFGVYQVVANLYTNSMLATLNSRRPLNQENQVTMNTFQVAAAIGGLTGTSGVISASGTSSTSGDIEDVVGPTGLDVGKHKNQSATMTVTSMREVRSMV